MKKVFIVFLLYLIKEASLLFCEADDKKMWSYHGSVNGPHYWGEVFPQCDRRHQSPIIINQNEANEEELFPLELSGFNKPITKATIENIGWTVIITPGDNEQRIMTYVYGVYYLISIHFHFGNKNEPGAEHILDGKAYPMEVHFHCITEREESAVLSTLIDVTDEDNPGFNAITNILSSVKYLGDSTELQDSLDLSNLLPEQSKDNYIYNLYLGSDSVPPCDPNYAWFVLRGIGTIGRDQYEAFTSLYSVTEGDASDDCLMGPNKRPVQKFRSILINGPVESERSLDF